jgi:hypothetical protein
MAKSLASNGRHLQSRRDIGRVIGKYWKYYMDNYTYSTRGFNLTMEKELLIAIAHDRISQ